MSSTSIRCKVLRVSANALFLGNMPVLLGNISVRVLEHAPLGERQRGRSPSKS
jgi:hypothetical protein